MSKFNFWSLLVKIEKVAEKDISSNISAIFDIVKLVYFDL